MVQSLHGRMKLIVSSAEQMVQIGNGLAVGFLGHRDQIEQLSIGQRGNRLVANEVDLYPVAGF